MRRELLLVAAILIFSQHAYAAAGSAVVIAVDYSALVPGARMQVPADYVAVPIDIENESPQSHRGRGENILIFKAFFSASPRLGGGF